MSQTVRGILVDGELVGFLPATDAENVGYGSGSVADALDDVSIPSSGTIDCRTVFGNNNTSGVCASAVIPLPNADNKTITIISCQSLGSSTEISVNVNKKSAIGFTITGGSSDVQGKTVNVKFTYS